MAFIPVPDTAQIRFEGAVDGQQTINDIYAFRAGGMVLSDLQSLVTNMVAWFQLSFAPNLSEDWHCVAVHGRDLTTALSFVVDQDAGATPGGTTGEAAPNNVAACISFRTGLAGRSFRGRNYIPAIPNSNVTLNTLDPSWMLGMTNAYGLLLFGGGALPAGWDWVIASRFSGVDGSGNPIPRVSGITTPIINTLFSNDIVDSQRRRLPGRGK